MAAKEKDGGQSVFRGVLLAHLIVALHIVLIGLLAVVILVIGGLARYALWIFIAVGAGGLLSAYLVYRRMKAGGGAALQHTIRDLSEKNGNVEVRLMGGLLSFRFRGADGSKQLDHRSAPGPRLLEDSGSRADREIAELVHLLATDQITAEEYSRARDQILNPHS